MVVNRILCLIVGYIFGLFATGYFYSRSKGVDLTTKGSGNTGATNTLRVMGIPSGVIVLLGDVFKTIIPCMLCRLVFKSQPEMILVYLLYVGFGVILGHDYPFYRGFKGGKGVASTGGLVIALGSFPVFIVSLIALVGTIVISHFVSLGSIIGVTVFFLSFTCCTYMGLLNIPDSCRIECCAMVLIVAIICIWRHRTNIKRLLSGNENKLF